LFLAASEHAALSWFKLYEESLPTFTIFEEGAVCCHFFSTLLGPH